MVHRYPYYLLLIVLLSIYGCKKSINPIVAPPAEVHDTVSHYNARVYITGSIAEDFGTEKFYVWDSNTFHVLTGSNTSSRVRCIAINEAGDIYTGGRSDNLPVYWKNGEQVKIDTKDSSGRVEDIAVKNNDVYVAGAASYATYYLAAGYWKNGKRFTLGNSDMKAGFTTCVTLSGNDVYFGGTVYTGDEPGNGGTTGAYWKNGALTLLERGDEHKVTVSDIVVKNNDVYAYRLYFG